MTFFRHEASSGIILLLFAILALVLANTSLSTFYNEVLNTQMPLGPAKWHLDLTILYWINDGLMAISSLLSVLNQTCNFSLVN